jgi:hypothetical protein
MSRWKYPHTLLGNPTKTQTMNLYFKGLTSGSLFKIKYTHY